MECGLPSSSSPPPGLICAGRVKSHQVNSVRACMRKLGTASHFPSEETRERLSVRPNQHATRSLDRSGNHSPGRPNHLVHFTAAPSKTLGEDDWWSSDVVNHCPAALNRPVLLAVTHLRLVCFGPTSAHRHCISSHRSASHRIFTV